MPFADERQAAAPSPMQTRHANVRVVDRAPGAASGPRNVFDLHAIADDIDHMGHVNNAVYLSWVQDVVVRRRGDMASEAEFAAYLWIAVKHEIVYRRPAMLGDALSATVIATGFCGARAMFDTVIRRRAQIIAEIKSVWCCLDAATHRPMRVGQRIVRRFIEDAAAHA